MGEGWRGGREQVFLWEFLFARGGYVGGMGRSEGEEEGRGGMCVEGKEEGKGEREDRGGRGAREGREKRGGREEGKERGQGTRVRAAQDAGW